MQQKIQPAVSDQKPGAPVALGEFPDVEAGAGGVPYSAYPPQKDDEIRPGTDDAGGRQSAGAERSLAGERCSLPARMLIGIVRGYQILISPWLPRCCRFTPSCSNYAIEALQKRGFWIGSFLTLWRLLRCQPFARGGYDPVPLRAEKISSKETAPK